MDDIKVMKERPLPKQTLANFNYLIQGTYCTISINRVREDIPMHIHKFNDEMQYYLEGEGDFRVGKNWCNIKPERIIYIPKGTVHGRPIRETVTLIALFTPKFDISKPDRAFVDEDGNQYS